MLNKIIEIIKKKLIPKPSEGVVTVADKNYFDGLVVLYYSVQKSYPVPLVCYDIGLTDQQLQWIKKNLPHLLIKNIPELDIIDSIKNDKNTSRLNKKSKRQWALWICPFLINESPFDRVLWLDCDLVVLRELKELFALLNNGPVFTPENLAPDRTENKAILYDLLPVDRIFDPSKSLINAGVSGWDLKRDKKILDYYMEAVYAAFSNPDIKNAISWHDQGALIWAIIKSNAEEYIVENRKWNCCVKHTAAYDKKYYWDKRVLNDLIADIPEVNIVHWNGCSVPWNK